MRFNLRWLTDYLETDLGYEKLLDAITMTGLEVEEAIDLGSGHGKIVFGEILELGSHPDADKLSLCKVGIGKGDPLQIVCGANNIEVGQRVPLALVGARFPDGMKLKATKIRGIASEGMMCSARELGVGEDHDGIWIQPGDSPLGEPFDAIIDIKVTPNRPDALSLVGVARDLAAKTGGTLKLPEVKFPEAGEKAESAARLVLEARQECPRYTARVIRNVQIADSPLWLKRRLESAGLRPRNNVVDVTNYVMLELGHPLHAFDLDKIADRTVVIRTAKPGEKMELLDDTEVLLEPTDLLICDTEKPIALAGVMGGGNSEISEATTNVLLEAAYFDPPTIRRTSKRLGKSTDASYRFERGTDPQKLVAALHRAAQLIAELSGGEVLKGFLDATAKLPEKVSIPLRIERFRMLSGLDLTGRQIADILTRLGFEIQRASEQELVAEVPSHRPDVFGEADLIEEVTRIFGYEKIPSEIPRLQSTADRPDALRCLTERLIDECMALGLSQAINFAFVSDEANAMVGISSSDSRNVRLLNPLSQDQVAMRRSLVPSMVQNVALNLNRGVESIRLFEIGKTYAWANAEEPEDEDPQTLEPPAHERPWLALALCGTTRATWRTPARELDFFDMKGLAESLLERLGITRVVVEPVTDVPTLHPGRGAALLKKGERVCWFGELHPEIAHKMDLKKRVYLLECPLDGPVLEQADAPAFREIPRTPPVKRDMAIVLPRDVPALDVERTIRSAGGEILAATRLFDVYEGKNVDPGQKSLAFSLTFRDPDPEKTLRDEQVNEVFQAIVDALGKKHRAALRG